MPYSAYVGPNGREPVTTDARTVGAALLPCTFVSESATAFAQITAPGTTLWRLLAPRDFYGTGQLDANDPLKTAYASGDTGIAYVLEVGQRYLVAAAAATYSYGQELTVAAAGRAAAAASTNRVVAFSRHVGAVSAGDLIEVEIALPYVKA
jgi:hypothetical protein